MPHCSPGLSPSLASSSARAFTDGSTAPRSSRAVRPPPSTSQSASFPVFSGHRRLRRRGPRSLAARERRLHRWAAASSGARAAESRAAPLGAPDDAPRASPKTSCLFSSPSLSSSPSATTLCPGQASDCDVACANLSSRCVASVSLSNASESHIFCPQSVDERAFLQHIRIWSINARKLLRRRAELEARLSNSGVDLLFVQETWLSDDVEEVSLQGYYLVGRLDRVFGPKRGFGGIATFARASLTSIALLEYVDTAERMYCVLRTHIGAILLGNWYRPPDDDGSSMVDLLAELRRLRGDSSVRFCLET